MTESPGGVPRFGAWTPVVVTVGLWMIAVVSWWLLADPSWSLGKPSSPLVDALLFWTILGFLATGFTFGSHGFSRLRQPVAGVAQVVVNLAVGVGGVWLFTRVLGSWDPTFSSSAPGGSGYLATAFVVLIAFYGFALVAAAWGGFPFESFPQPLGGVGQLYQSIVITVVGVVWLIYPNFSSALAKNAPVALPTVIGWVYSCIVVVIMAAMIWENWPWSMIQQRSVRAAAALVVSMAGGYGVYWLFRVVLRVLVPADIRGLPTFSESIEAAQLGVCFSLWAITWGLVFGARPTQYSATVNRLARTAIVIVLSVATYEVFMRGMATKVLHMPAMQGSYGGDPLTWINWLILIVLWYAVAFGSFLSHKPSD
ncbi:hypothetical protein [uncultured Nocardioides sp.]|uniref:hypothetical protein n=1 Tax=uncultured Nocardioides sp. TaxID=198441 RepID=UPI00260405B9|nr:hypothetical protein [uncultured Nocardioides sp.]